MDTGIVLEACARLAEQLGLGETVPRVVGQGSNLVVALEPLPIVVRVATGTALLRDAETFARREVGIGEFLARAGAPLAGPCEQPLAGPHHVESGVGDGWTTSLWRRIDILDTAADAREAGRRLRDCHAALRDYPEVVPRLGMLDELDQLLGHPLVTQTSSAHDRAFVTEQAAICRRRLQESDAILQPLHGDAHLRNVFSTADGPLWADWEDTISAPIEWDLACLVTTARVEDRDRERAEAALAAYGDHDAALLELCVHARALFLMGWLWLLSVDHPARQARAAQWMQWLRAAAADQ